jgi:hypothetical protein
MINIIALDDDGNKNDKFAGRMKTAEHKRKEHKQNEQKKEKERLDRIENERA